MRGIDKEKNTVIIYSDIELVNGNSAGSARMMNYARSLSKYYNVLLLSFPRGKAISDKKLVRIESGIYTTGQEIKIYNIIEYLVYPFLLFRFILSIKKISNKLKIDNSPCILLLYPSKRILIDVLSILLLKNTKCRVYYEVNEIRRYAAIYQRNERNIGKRIRIKIEQNKYFLAEKATKFFNGLICISTNIEEFFKKYNDNTVLIPILTKRVRPDFCKTKKWNNNTPFKIGFFGSISYDKENLGLLLESINFVLNNKIECRLQLYGAIDNYTREKLNCDIKKLKLQNSVYIYGFINQDLVLKEMTGNHLLVLPRGINTQTKYGFSTKLSEYLLSGIPTLVTAVSDNPKYIKDGNNGFIVPPDDSDSFSNKILKIIKNYNEVSPKIYLNSQLTINEHFYYGVYSQKFRDFFEKSKM